MNRFSPAPILPPRSGAFSQTFLRSIIATAQAQEGGEVADIVRRRWPDDRATLDWVTRAASTITSTTTANVPTATSVAALIPLLAPASAAAAILKRCLNLNFDDASAISLPLLLASGAGVSFIGQGLPFPIRQFALTSSTLNLKKLAFGCVVTRELFEHSNAETFLSNLIGLDLALGIETILFDAVAADTVRPAGLKNGIGATAATAGATIDSMFADLANLGAIVSAVDGGSSGNLNFCYIASPKQAIKINLRKSQNNFPFPVYASSGLADGQIACLSLDALAVAATGLPRFEMSRNAVLHMEDTTPLPFSTVGAPNTIAAPMQSAFQQDLVALRIIQDLSWMLRSNTGFAWINAVNW